MLFSPTLQKVKPKLKHTPAENHKIHKLKLLLANILLFAHFWCWAGPSEASSASDNGSSGSEIRNKIHSCCIFAVTMMCALYFAIFWVGSLNQSLLLSLFSVKSFPMDYKVMVCVQWRPCWDLYFRSFDKLIQTLLLWILLALLTAWNNSKQTQVLISEIQNVALLSCCLFLDIIDDTYSCYVPVKE